MLITDSDYEVDWLSCRLVCADDSTLRVVLASRNLCLSEVTGGAVQVDEFTRKDHPRDCDVRQRDARAMAM